MGRIDNTVFLSYRRTNIGYALAIYQNLTAQGYDVFFDYNSIDSGDFEQIILNNIASRAHFVVLLTPSAIERVNEEGDWLRREIEYAIETKRNIVPLTMEGFDWKVVQDKLTGKLAPLGNYNALRVPADYFMEAMDRLAARFLNVEIDAVIHPRNAQAQQAAASATVEADEQPKVEENELSAQEWFEKGYQATDYDEKIKFYSEAIRLNSNHAISYYNRANAYDDKGDLEGALDDYTEAIRLRSDFIQAYINRGELLFRIRQYSEAFADFKKVYELKSGFNFAIAGLAVSYHKLGKVPQASNLWKMLMDIDNQYKDADWTANKLNWPDSMREEARKLVSKL